MNVTCVKPNLPFSPVIWFLSCRSKTRSRRTRGKRRSTWSSLTHPQPTTPTSLQTTPSSALRWTRPCPVPLVRWGSWEENLKGVGVVLSTCWRRKETLFMNVIYVTEARVHKLSQLNIHSFFGYWLLSFRVLLSFFVYPVSIPYFSLFLNLYILHTSSTPVLLRSRPSPRRSLHRSSIVFLFSPARFPCFPVVLTPSLCVCLCVLLCTARSPWAASSSPARYLRMPTRTRAAATCWSSWTIRCPPRRSLAPPTRPPLWPDQCPTTWMVSGQICFSWPLTSIFKGVEQCTV